MAELRKKKQIGQTGTDRSAEYAGMAGMSALDQAALKAAGSAWNKANQAGDRAGMDAAHSQADRIRGKYGYSGGAAGDQYLPTGSPGAFSYQQAPSYASKYDVAIAALTEQLLGREEFSYDHTQDPLYQQMEAQYTKGAQRAMDDTLGKVAARTGGIASSYAASAAQGAYNEHMEGLASQIPALQQLAYAMHMDKQEGKRADLNLLLGLEEQDYGRHLDALGQFNNDRSFAYGMSRDALNDRRYDEEQAYGRAADKAALLGAAGDFSGYQALGFSPAEIAALTAASRREQTAGSARSAGSKSASGAAPTGDVYGQMYSGGIRTTGDAYAYLLGQGYSSTEAKQLAEYFTGQVEDGSLEARAQEAAWAQAEPDLDSVLKLGYGPISADYLDELIRSGEVEEYLEDGAIKFRRKEKPKTNNRLLDLAGLVKPLTR